MYSRLLQEARDNLRDVQGQVLEIEATIQTLRASVFSSWISWARLGRERYMNWGASKNKPGPIQVCGWGFLT
jgi:hypothetical protein